MPINSGNTHLEGNTQHQLWKAEMIFFKD